MPTFFTKNDDGNLFGRVRRSKRTAKHKYYSSHTCYDGAREFPESITDGRHYPDEDVIVSIVNAYLKTKKNLREKIRLVTETMHWNRQGVLIRLLDVREVIRNNIKFNDLLVVVFHYHYHHMFLVIDTKNKYILYHDPMGRSPEQCLSAGQEQYKNLVDYLNDLNDIEGYMIEYALHKQQLDGVSCGPLVAQSICETIDSYLQKGDLRGISFPQPREKLVSLKINLMNYQNQNFMQSGDLIFEEMLATQEMYLKFLQENNISDDHNLFWIGYMIFIDFFSEGTNLVENIYGVVNKSAFQKHFFDSIINAQNNISAYQAHIDEANKQMLKAHGASVSDHDDIDSSEQLDMPCCIIL